MDASECGVLPNFNIEDILDPSSSPLDEIFQFPQAVETDEDPHSISKDDIILEVYDLVDLATGTPQPEHQERSVTPGNPLANLQLPSKVIGEFVDMKNCRVLGEYNKNEN